MRDEQKFEQDWMNRLVTCDKYNLVSDELKKKIKIKDECQQLIYIPNMKGSFIKTDHVVMPRKPRP